MPLQRHYSQLRASDAERERVVAFMREHALVGRLNDEELEERIGLAYAAVTVGDLERLIADLPRANRPAPRRIAPPQHRPDFKPLLMVCGAVFLALVVGPIVLGLAIGVLALVFTLGFLLGPFFLVALLVVLATRRRRPPPPSMRWGPQY
ncbi:MAG TPA: DUF1707 domain-containing protein [Solirubrobacter sp.]|nr:DUF1707 domain-containing protein [Solirubrobacter sp.]